MTAPETPTPTLAALLHEERIGCAFSTRHTAEGEPVALCVKNGVHDSHAARLRAAGVTLDPLRIKEAAQALVDAGCWGHADHSPDTCKAGALRAALALKEPTDDRRRPPRRVAAQGMGPTVS